MTSEGWQSIPAMAAAAAERFGDRAAVVDGDTRLSYAALDDRSRTFGAALVASGIQPGERVALWAPNSAEWIVAVLGLLRAGAVLVPVNTRFKGAEAADILGRSRARALVTVTDFLGTDHLALLDAAGADLPDLTTVVVARGKARAGTEPWDGFLARATGEAGAELDRRSADITADYPSDVLFTSGTTGQPKGVVMTHGRTLGVATDWVAMTGLGPDDRYLMVNPYFHMFGLKAGILASIAAGATMLPEPVFEVDRVLSRVAAERVTALPGAPTIYQSILDHPDLSRFDMSSLRWALTGAATVPVEMVRRMRAELSFETIITGYGLTETIGITSVCRPDDDLETIATTAGRPIPGVEVAIVDDGGRRLGAEEPGEVLTRGPNMMLGYFADPEASREALDADGWLHTGDIGVVDDAGNLRITDRKKDMFVVGGFNAYPAEIENIMANHPAVGQVAVVGVPDHRLGEVGRAYVVPRAGVTVDPAELIAWCREQMANYKVPRSVEVVDALPLNATGKVLKYVLREQAAAGR